MRSVRFYAWCSRIIRLALGGILLWASVWKIVAPAEFMVSIQQYALVGAATASVAAGMLPWVEFVVAVCLLAGRFTSGALLICIVMFVTFGAAQASVLYRGLAVDCGCGLLPGHGRITVLTLLRSGVFVVVSVLGCFVTARAQSAAQPLRKRLEEPVRCS